MQILRAFGPFAANLEVASVNGADSISRFFVLVQDLNQDVFEIFIAVVLNPMLYD
jgi:hypothetical protein